MAIREMVGLLVAESERLRLVERALAEFDQWVEWQGGTVGGIQRAELDVSFHEQILIFKTAIPSAGPHLVTRLAFVFRGPDDDGLNGIYEVQTKPDGEAFRERVNLVGSLSLETLRRGVWRFTGRDYEYNGDIPRSLPNREPNIPW